MMSSLARRMATSSLCGASQTQHSPNTSTALPYPTRMEKVKFGTPLESVCGAHNDIPGPLLVMILKLNKEAPFKKDVFRAPGHQANMKKLIHFLQNGRLVNIDNYSVYTIASVLKKFLRKLPSGVFGTEREQRLFQIIEWENVEEKRQEIHRILTSLPVVTQHLLVLLFGTFRAMATCSERASTGMTSEAIGVSVAPSFFHSCVQDGSKFARMEDVQRFKAQIAVATTIMKFLIDNFGVCNLFGRDNYEYYARISGRVLKVEENWIFAFKYPPDTQHNTPISSSEECQSSPTLCTSGSSSVTVPPLSSVHMINQNIEDTYARLSMSLEETIFKSHHSSPNSPQTIVMMHQNQQTSQPQQTQAMVTEEALNLDDLKSVNRYAESTKSLTFLPIVHERQTQRMKTRSEWFLNPDNGVSSSHSFTSSTTTANNRKSVDHSLSSSMCGSSVKQLVRRTSSKEKRLVRRSSSKKDKENGSEHKTQHTSGTNNGFQLSASSVSNSDANQLVTNQTSMCSESESTDCDVQQKNTTNTTLIYKPRI
ncbi:uncharacterized protein LOC128957448 isoform X2 [Oppia nitens]|uniref:uncharacterized protein LOC128957448 isoform X2 n=1 Tax=Oppia nitens TaxID=1686743 RepID=UPI0023DBBAA2|nr:uncharacterized protein LOC128957448 isoform X2 [Oppia nitens]